MAGLHATGWARWGPVGVLLGAGWGKRWLMSARAPPEPHWVARCRVHPRRSCAAQHVQAPCARTCPSCSHNRLHCTQVGYVRSWSAYNTYRAQHPEAPDPLVGFEKDLLSALGSQDPSTRLQVVTPLVMLLGMHPRPLSEDTQPAGA